MRRNIHPFMQNPNNKDSRIVEHINGQMFFMVMDSHRRFEFQPLRRAFRILGKLAEFLSSPDR